MSGFPSRPHAQRSTRSPDRHAPVREEGTKERSKRILGFLQRWMAKKQLPARVDNKCVSGAPPEITNIFS
jgi:hypothetical protein